MVLVSPQFIIQTTMAPSRYPRSSLVDAVCLNDLEKVKDFFQNHHQQRGDDSHDTNHGNASGMITNHDDYEFESTTHRDHRIALLLQREEFRRAYYHSIRLNRISMVQLFLERGADAQTFSKICHQEFFPMDNETGQPQTPLVMAVLAHHIDIIRLLQAYGASLLSPPSYYNGGAGEIGDAGQCLLSRVVAKFHPRVVGTIRVLVEELGASVHQVSGSDQATPLLRACAHGTVSAVECMLRYCAIAATAAVAAGDDPTRWIIIHPPLPKNADGKTPLMLAAGSHPHPTQALQIMKLLLLQDTATDGSIGVLTIDSKDKSGKTALHHACGGSPRKGDDSSSMARVLLLLEHGADPATTDIHGCTPLEVAYQRGQINTAFILFQRMLGLGQIEVVSTVW